MNARQPVSSRRPSRLLSDSTSTDIASIPKYVLYGDSPDTGGKWSLNVEPLADRCKERGWNIGLHRHPSFGQMVFVRSGRGTFTIEDRAVAFRSPCIMIVPLQCAHGFDYEEDSDGWVLTIADHYLNQINTRLPEFATLWSHPRVINLRRDEETAELRDTIIKLQRELTVKTVGHFLAAETYLMGIFLSVLRRASSSVRKVPKLSSNEVKLVEEFRNLIEENYRQGWKVGDFSSVLGVSLSRLRSACEAVCGETPIKMIHQRRLTEAKRDLLFTDMTLEQIAYWLGFSSPCYFAKFFKNETGEPPAHYRRMRRGGKPD